MSNANEEFARSIRYHAKETGQRTGQALFNTLPLGAANAVIGCIWDPFNRDYSSQELVNWVNEHLILDDDVNVVGVIGANQILWEDEGGVA